MGRGDNGADAVFYGNMTHFKCHLNRWRPIVETRQDVAVKIYHAFLPYSWRNKKSSMHAGIIILLRILRYSGINPAVFFTVIFMP